MSCSKRSTAHISSILRAPHTNHNPGVLHFYDQPSNQECSLQPARTFQPAMMALCLIVNALLETIVI